MTSSAYQMPGFPSTVKSLVNEAGVLIGLADTPRGCSRGNGELCRNNKGHRCYGFAIARGLPVCLCVCARERVRVLAPGGTMLLVEREIELFQVAVHARILSCRCSGLP